MEHLTNYTNLEVIELLIKHYKTWDITSLSMTFLQLVGLNIEVFEHNKDFIVTQFMKLLIANISHDASTIISCTEIVNYLSYFKLKKK